MFDTLRRLLRDLLDRDKEPPCCYEPKQAGRKPDNDHDHPARRPEDRPDTDWADWINRPPDGGDWLRERLRSLPDEEKEQKPTGPKHRHGL